MAGAAPPQEVPPHEASPVLHSCTGHSRTDWGCPCLPQVFWAQILAQQHAAPCKEPPRGGSRLSQVLSTSLCPSGPWVDPLLGTTPRELAVDEQPASAPLKFGAREPRQQGCDRGGSALL